MAPDRTAEEVHRGLDRVYLLVAALVVLAPFLAVTISMIRFQQHVEVVEGPADCGDDTSECSSYEFED